MVTIDYSPQTISAEELNDAAEFFSPFLVNEDGTVELSGNFEPDEVIGNYPERGDIFISDGWTAWSHGYTGQWGYSGPVMHDSEYLGGRLAEDILSTPGEYCLMPVTYLGYLGWEDSQDEGWIVLKAV